MRSVELFVGAGGLGLGASQAGFEPLVAVEWDKHCCDTIRENQQQGFPTVQGWPLVEGDVRALDFSKYLDKVDLVSGGPPCQPFSMGGKHNGRLDERDMFPQAVRAVRETRPRAFVFENVKGLTRAAFRNYLEYIRLQLTHPYVVQEDDETWIDHLARLEKYHTQGRTSGLQYRVVSRVLNAADFGVPQKRERIFIVGFRTDLGVDWSFPEPTYSQDALIWSQCHSEEYWDNHRVARKARLVSERTRQRARKLSAAPNPRPWRTVRDALDGLPDPETRPRAAAEFSNHIFQPGARSYPGHTGSPLDEPAKTLKAGVHGVPGGENMLRRPDGSIRYFSVRESARLQTFPDVFRFHGSWTETMRQLGNAVPVTLAEVVAHSVLRQLEIRNEANRTLQSVRQAQSRKECR